MNAFRTDVNGLPYLDGTQNSESVTSADYAGNVDPRLDFTLGRIGMPWRSYQYNEKWCRNFELYGQYSGKSLIPLLIRLTLKWASFLGEHRRSTMSSSAMPMYCS